MSTDVVMDRVTQGIVRALEAEFEAGLSLLGAALDPEAEGTIKGYHSTATVPVVALAPLRSAWREALGGGPGGGLWLQVLGDGVYLRVEPYVVPRVNTAAARIHLRSRRGGTEIYRLVRETGHPFALDQLNEHGILYCLEHEATGKRMQAAELRSAEWISLGTDATRMVPPAAGKTVADTPAGRMAHAYAFQIPRDFARALSDLFFRDGQAVVPAPLFCLHAQAMAAEICRAATRGSEVRDYGLQRLLGHAIVFPELKAAIRRKA